MRDFGKSQGGGHRGAERTVASLPVILRTLASSRAAALVDISATGARLRGQTLPRPGQVLEMTIDPLKTFGAVIWATDEECGVAFDESLAPFELNALRKTAGLANLSKLSVDERLALDDWLLGMAR